MNDEKTVGGGRNDDFKSAEAYKEFEVDITEGSEFPSKIERTDIKAHQIEAGETEIVLQRHGAYVRDRNAENVGSLSEESAKDEMEASLSYFESFFSQLTPEERSTVDILFLASDTQYFEGGRRSYETGVIAQEAAKKIMEKYEVPAGNIIQESDPLSREGAPRVMPRLREPNMLNDSPDFLDFMLKQYGGINLEFWVAFEEDKHKEVREAMGAEGPDDIADRMGFTIRTFARYADTYHKQNPYRRLIIWGATHYDTISPYVKRDVFGVGKETQLMVDYGAGITIDIDKDGKAITEIANKTYSVPTKKLPKV